jgi:guanine deaminase
MPNPFMQRAIALSIENIRAGRGGPFGCVVARDGQIVAEGTNLVTSTNDPTAHAEVVAIRKACETLQTWQLSDCEIYASCEPCPMCLGAIYWARPSKLFFANTAQDAAAIGFDDHFIYEQLALQHHERSIPTNQLMREEAMEAFRLWKNIVDKVEY